MKGIHNRQKMMVMPRESVEKRRFNALKIRSKEVLQKGKFEKVKSKFKNELH